MPARSETVIRTYTNPDRRNERWIFTQKNGGDSPITAFVSRFSHDKTGQPFTHEEMGQNQDARDAFLQMLGNRNANNLYTVKELCDLFHLSESSVKEKLRNRKDYVSPIPETKEAKIPPGDMAFFIGLTFGDFRIKEGPWNSHNFVTVGTHSDKRKHRDALRKTLGTWGEINEGARGPKVFLNPSSFHFLLDENSRRKLIDQALKKPHIFPAFVLGLLMGKLSERQNRVSLHDRKLLERINLVFEETFEFPMGRITIEQRANDQLAALLVHNPEEVFSALIQTKSVQQLSFFRNLFDVPQKQSAA